MKDVNKREVRQSEEALTGSVKTAAIGNSKSQDF